MKQYISLFTIALLTLSLFTACNSQTSAQEQEIPVTTSAEEQTQQAPPEVPPEDKARTPVTLGKITAIDGNSITLAISKMEKNREDNPKEDTERPKPNGEPPAEREPDINNPQPTTEEMTPPAEGSAPGDIFESSETFTLSIDDSIRIYIEKNKEKSEGTLEDLAVDKIVQLAYDESGTTPISITVMEEMDMPESPSSIQG